MYMVFIALLTYEKLKHFKNCTKCNIAIDENRVISGTDSMKYYSYIICK